LTVEFWFRTKDVAPVDEQHVLFEMNAGSEPSLTIYIEDGLLKCAPFGITTDGDHHLVLVYEGILPLEETRWQHVSCAFHQMRLI
jgi:hypothetical protein